jgi:DNA-binding protein H-NS
MSIDLSNMTQDELDALIAAAGEQKKKKLRERIGEVRRKLTAMAKDEGYSIEELFGMGKGATAGSGSRRKVEAKYRNPANPEQTWSGRGKRSSWLEKEIAAGKKLEDFLI